MVNWIFFFFVRVVLVQVKRGRTTFTALLCGGNSATYSSEASLSLTDKSNGFED